VQYSGRRCECAFLTNRMVNRRGTRAGGGQTGIHMDKRNMYMSDTASMSTQYEHTRVHRSNRNRVRNRNRNRAQAKTLAVLIARRIGGFTLSHEKCAPPTIWSADLLAAQQVPTER
jgi:hypothetical protein